MTTSNSYITKESFRFIPARRFYGETKGRCDYRAHGSAYAISENGAIVGVSDTGAFIANAYDAKPRARPLDELIPSLGNRHVQAAFGIADNDSILALVVGKDGKRELAVLVPQRAEH